MRTAWVTPLLIAGLLALGAPPAAAQQAAHAGHAMAAGVMQDLMNDARQVEEKLVGLAEAIPPEKWSWRPGAGVRSVGEVFLHVAADNYFMPTAAGVMAPAASGIKADDYASTQTYEQMKLSQQGILGEMKASFAHLYGAMEAADEAKLDEPMEMFGEKLTGRQMWIMATMHLHEHLGQMIAYARSNGVVPPWSR